MNIRQMRYILEIAKEGNITTAAGNLFISQPSLSILLTNVEKELGTKLFDRSTTPITLTYAGEKYVQAAGRVLGTLNELQQEIDDLKDSLTGRLRVGCSPQLSPFVIPAVLPTIREKYPGIDFNLAEESPAMLSEMLLNGSLDVLVCGESVNHPGFTRLPLIKEDFVLLAPQGYTVYTVSPGGRKKRFDCVDLQKMSGNPFVLMKKRHNLRKTQDLILEEGGCKPNVILETSNLQTCLRMVTSGMAFTVMPYVESGLPSGAVDLYSFERDYCRRTILVHRKGAYYPKVLDAFIKTAQEIFETADDTFAG